MADLRPLAAVALFVLAGCVDDAAGPVPMKDRLAHATESALRWSPDAYLVAAYALETSDPAALAPFLNGFDGNLTWHETDMALAVRDDDVGDGRALTWAFVFSDGELLAVATAAPGGGGGLQAPGVTPWFPDVEGATALAGYTIGSEEAAAAARAQLPAEATTVRMVLAAQGIGERPFWRLHTATAEDPLATGGPVVHVDATNGATYTDDAFHGAFDLPWEAFHNGTVATTGGAQGFDFRLTDGLHDELRWALTIEDGAPLHTLEATLMGPAGETMEMVWEGGPTPQSAVVLGPPLAEPSAGEWRVEVHLRQGAQQAYALHLCADGVGDAPEGNVACTA